MKYTCELYITNRSYSNKVVIVFAMYQRMRSKGTYWDGPRLRNQGLEVDDDMEPAPEDVPSVNNPSADTLF